MRLSASIAVLGTTLSACAQDGKAWNFSGYVDGYFQYDFGRPASGDNVNGRGFDIAHNRLRFAVAQLDVTKAVSERDPWGLTLQVYAGKNADLVHLAEPGGKDKYKFLRQAYVTYADPRSSVRVDLGKFDTWIGYEGYDSRTQDQYGRSFNWTYSEPTYETGVRASTKLSDKASLTLFLVRGWNEVEDGNDSPSVGASLSYALNPKTTLTVQNHYGDEGSNRVNDAGSYGGIGFPQAGVSKVHLLDLIIAHQLSPETTVAFNLDHATSAGAPNSGTWNGQALYLKHRLSEARALAFRLERVEDRDGLRTGSSLKLHSLTGTFDQALGKAVTLRFELRRDFASAPFFNADNGLSRNRTTIGVAAIVKF